MDRFVSRTPTWKTLNYSSMAAQSFAAKGAASGALKKTPGDNKKKPLQQKQLSDLSTKEPYDFDKRIGDLLPSTQQQPQQITNVDNFNGNSNDSGLSSASSISPQQFDDNLAGGFNAASPFKKLSTPSKKHLGKLSDYIDCPLEKENDTYMTLTSRSPKSHKKLVESGGLQIQKTLETVNKFTLQQQHQQVQGTPERPLTSVNNMIMARIQRDLDSPSAAARMKALKALKSPTKSAYTHFDIPEAEQSLHLPEPPSLQEIMRNIVVYVEVRSGEDNRSAGVRKVIEALGARVNLSLNRDTTHVVFKDGLLSTFKKATQMNIPIVSILWIEACKNQRRICDPKDYPISNLDRYENPELYTKMKRVKSMQPDSECNKRIRVKTGGTPKDSTPTQKTAGNLKKTSTLIGGTPTSSTNKKKTDISQFFKKLERATPTSTAKLNGGDSNHIPESPATLLLNRINSECYTPLNELKKKAIDSKENEKEKSAETINDKVSNGAGGCGGGVGAKKALDFLQTESSPKVTQENGIKTTTTRNRRSSVLMQQNSVVESEASMDLPSSVTVRRGKQRRHSLMNNNELDTATQCLNTMTISMATPTKSTRRRSSLHTPKDMSVVTETPGKLNNIAPILEENDEMEQQQREQEKPPKSVTKRRTLYNAKTMEQTELLSENTNKDMETPNKKSTRRRTLYNTKTMETSDINPELSHNSVKRRTCYSVKSLEQTEEETETKKSLTIEVTNVDEIKTPTTTSSKLEKNTNRRRTLYGGETSMSPNLMETSGLCLTPTNFQTGRVVASSTLLEDSANRSHLIATPPADATTGKLLEETEQCATPLIFSSTRQPGNKRRTLFDVSMDIITQRLQCINQSARRSLAPPTPSAEIINTGNITPIDIKKSTSNLLKQTTPHSSTETLNECTNSNDGATTATAESNTLKKKRKLFMPNELLATPTPAPAKASTTETVDDSQTSNKTGNSNSVQKRRRTLMPISQPQLPTLVTLKDSCNSTTNVRKRRSTLDFEQIQNIKTKAQSKESSCSSSAAATNQTKSKTKKSPVLVYTNMHQQQIEVIREAINKLGLFTLESNVTDATTHLVSLEPRRTLNILKALTRGLWILDYNWIQESLKAGQWLAEEAYELRNFSKGVEISRSERQAFGSNYKCDLFHRFGAFYVSSQCSPINKESIRELITLCGGRVVNTRQKARYIIGDSNRKLEDKIYLTPFWILDSITQMQIQKVNKYMHPLPDGKSASQPLT